MTPISAKTCMQAWLQAAAHLRGTSSWRDYNLILEIAEPMNLPPEDKKVYDLADKFLEVHASTSLSTIINTIFPATLYRRYGAVGVFEHYPKMWSAVKQHPDIQWGTYFRRMTHSTKRDGVNFNPLEKLVAKLKAQVATGAPKQAAYEVGLCADHEDIEAEIPIYLCGVDAGRTMGGPCLSHLSFKLKEGNQLMLTAFYRSHYYVHRALGNLLGLAWLQHFVASEVGVRSGEMVCISSMATLDTDGWTKGDVRGLLDNCEKAVGRDPHTGTGFVSVAS